MVNDFLSACIRDCVSLVRWLASTLVCFQDPSSQISYAFIPPWQIFFMLCLWVLLCNYCMFLCNGSVMAGSVLDQFWIYLLHLTTTPFPAPCCCLFWNWFQSYRTDHTQSMVVKAPYFLLFLWSIGCLKAQFQPLCHTMLMMYNAIIWPCFLASLHHHTANSRSCESLDIHQEKKTTVQSWLLVLAYFYKYKFQIHLQF